MRFLFTIPHYFQHSNDEILSSTGKRHGSTSANVETRLAALRKTILSIHQLFGPSQAMIQIADRRTIAANESTRAEVQIVIVTSGSNHLTESLELPQNTYHQIDSSVNPVHLGFECHKVLRDRWGNYDYYGYLEDDLALQDPWFFEKLRWFNSHLGDESLLLPNRYERASNLAYKKCYLDGDLSAHVTKPFQDIGVKPVLKSTLLGREIQFQRPLNPHAGCFFLNAEQTRIWLQQPEFAVPSSAFIGPLESAATLGIMRSFRIYKPSPENANFLEIEHDSDRFLRLIRTR